MKLLKHVLKQLNVTESYTLWAPPPKKIRELFSVKHEFADMEFLMSRSKSQLLVFIKVHQSVRFLNINVKLRISYIFKAFNKKILNSVFDDIINY